MKLVLVINSEVKVRTSNSGNIKLNCNYYFFPTIVQERQLMDYATLKNLVKFLDQSLIGVIIIDLDTRVKYINRNYEIFFLNTFGYKLEEDTLLKNLAGQSNELQKYIGIWESVFKGESFYDSNQNFYGNIIDSQSKIAGGYSINSGVYNNETLKHIVKIASTENLMLAKANHELRTPLVSIVGSAQLLDLSIPKSDDYKQYRQHIKCILQSSEHLKSMIDDFMDYSKLALGKVIVNTNEKINVQKTIDKCINIMMPHAQKLGITISKTFDIDTNKFYIIKGDQNRLLQVLINLLSNAIKYNKEKGKVLVECKLKGRIVEISIVDTGIGIAGSDLEKLFQPYTRFGLKVDQVEGTGLGLNVAKKLVMAMNGKILVKSKFNVGTRFTIVFPLDSIVSDDREDSDSVNIKYVVYIDNSGLQYFTYIKNYFDIRYSQNIKLLAAIGIDTAKKICEHYSPSLIIATAETKNLQEIKCKVPIITIGKSDDLPNAQVVEIPLDMEPFLKITDKYLLMN
jgi:signal transduction histidine kinase